MKPFVAIWQISDQDIQARTAGPMQYALFQTAMEQWKCEIFIRIVKIKYT